MAEITKASKVSLALAGGVCATVLFGANWIQGRVQSLDTVCREIQFEQRRVVERLDRMSADLWTRQQMANWALRLKIANSGVTVPSPTGEGEVN